MSKNLQITDPHYIAPRFKCRLSAMAMVCIGAFSCSLVSSQVKAQAAYTQASSEDMSGSVGSGLSSPSDLVPAGVPGDEPTAPTVLPAEILGKSDLIEIRVPYCPELSHSFRIGTDGMLVVPLLHQELKIAGLTPAQAAAHIRWALIAEQVMPDPTVNVSVVEYRSRPVSIVGAVVHPLTFQATGEITLLDAIAMAGGFVPGGATDVLISSRHVNAEGKMDFSVTTIPVRGLLLQATTASNIMLRGGEEIRVTEAGKVFVAGNVVKPGAYVMQGEEDTTVLKALALSSGLQQYSAHTAYIYRRRLTGGEREEIRVPLSRIIARKDPDVSLVADDILYIPDNNGKRVTARVLSQISGFSQTTATGLLIYK